MEEDMMRKIMVIMACLAVVLGALTASGAEASSHSRRAGCGTVVWTPPSPHTATTRWRTNPCHYLQRAHLKCESRGYFHNFNGGWEEGTLGQDTSYISCPTGYNPYCFGFEWETNTSGPEYVEWAWPTTDCDLSHQVVLR